MVLARKTYRKKYIGNENSRRTQAYQNKGIDPAKYIVKPSPYTGISKIIRKKPHRDITGYLINGRVHSAKNRTDSSKKSKAQSWE